jgi:hypothetical protein
MDFDPTVTIEGAATALAVVGAATGYLINLSTTWWQERKRKRYVGTRMVILDLLERNMGTGLSEEQLWELYRSPGTEERRKYYSAWPPKEIDRLDFEREVRQLQLDFLVDLAGEDHYRARVHPFDSYDTEKLKRSAVTAQLQGSVNRDKLRNVALRALEDPGLTYERDNAMRLLLGMADRISVDIVTRQLESQDTRLSLSAAQVLADYLPPNDTGTGAGA